MPEIFFSCSRFYRKDCNCKLDGYVFKNIFLVVINKWIKMVNFKLGNEMWKVNWSTLHESRRKKNLSPLQESNSWRTSNTGQVLYPIDINSVTVILLSLSSCSSVEWMPARVSGGHRFDSCQGLRFFFVPRSCHVDQFIFTFSLFFFSPVCLFSYKEISFPKDVTNFCCVTKRTLCHAR